MFDIKNPYIPLMSYEGLEQVMLIYRGLYAKGDYNLSSASYLTNMVKFPTDHNSIGNNKEEFYALRSHCCVQEICYLLKAMEEDVKRYGVEGYINIKRRQSNIPNFLACLNATDISAAMDYPKDMIQKSIERNEISSLPRLIQFLYENNKTIDDNHAGMNTLPFVINKEVFDSNHVGQGRKRFRVYINNPLGKVGVDFYLIFIKKLIEQRIPYSDKFNYNTIIERKDKSIFYFPVEYLNEVTKILDEIYIEYPELISNFGTPIPACAQGTYYGISHTGAGANMRLKTRTYNMFINDVTSCAYFIYFCRQLVLFHGEVFSTMAEEEKTFVRKYAQGVLNEDVFNELYNCNVFQSPLIKQIIGKYSNKFRVAIQPKDYINILKRVVSVRMYGDLEHIDYPICFNESFYDLTLSSSKNL